MKSRLPIDTIVFPNDRTIAVHASEEAVDTALKTLWQSIEQGADVYHAVVAALAVATGCQWVFASHLLDEQQRVEILAMWDRTGFADCFQYQLVGTPCDLVIKSQNAVLLERVTESFPEDRYLVEMGVVDYLGLSYKDTQGVVSGHISIMDDQPFQQIAIMQNTLTAVTKALEIELQSF